MNSTNERRGNAHDDDPDDPDADDADDVGLDK